MTKRTSRRHHASSPPGNMADREDSDGRPVPALLAEMSSASPPSTGSPAPFAATTWTALASSTRSSPAQPTARHSTTFLPRRTISQGQTHAPTDPDAASHLQSPFALPHNVFSTPGRSIFASGPPTAAVSASLVHASMSSPPPNIPSTSSLSAFASSSNHSARRLPLASIHPPSTFRSRGARLSDIEKDTEDPSGSPLRNRMATPRREEGTPTAVSQLFAAPEPTSPTISRHPSYIRTSSGTHYTRAMPVETAPLPNHLYTKGLLSGRHSDITVIAFDTRYPLHRLLLDRAPYFCSALSEPWLESSAKEITLHPEEIDANITQAAFELALKRIYGCHKEEEEDKEAIGLFATGCWLDMADLIMASLHSLLRQLKPANIATYIRLVTQNYYGRHGDRILAAAKSMLCRDGWEMPLTYFDGISGEIIREIVGSDGFYVLGEWDRFHVAKKILNRRLRSVAFELGLTDKNGMPLVPKPDSLKFTALRFDSVYRKTTTLTPSIALEGGEKWLGLYTSTDIAPLLVLLDEGIHYVHMSFEQLQRVRQMRDAMGLPIVPEKVITDALWMSMELRQYVVNARDSQVELGIAHIVQHEEEQNEEPPAASSFNLQSEMATYSTGPDLHRSTEDEQVSESWDMNGKPRKFWIPLIDATFSLGGDLEPINPDNASQARHLHRFSASMEPQDTPWVTDFTSSLQDRSESPTEVANGPNPNIRYTHYPPFRFAVEFPSLKKLKEKKRVYSPTIWYAGSLWNVYVQKRVGPRHTQLGVFLHRKRIPDMANGDGSGLRNSSVDQRIDQLEREMLGNRNRRQFHQSLPAGNLREESGSSDDAGMGSPSAARTRPAQDITTLSGLLRSARGVNKASEHGSLLHDAIARPQSTALEGPRLEDERDEAPSTSTRPEPTVPTIPPYFDARPITCTFFKIYTPSKSGRVLTVYESGPDRFECGQSWGWRSSNLVLDDGLANDFPDEDSHRSADSKLRFTIVFGNV